MEGGPQRCPQRPSAVDLRVVRQRSAHGNPGLRGWRPRSSQRTQSRFEASVRHDEGIVCLAATAYLNKFSNFIFQAPAGVSEDDVPIYSYRQGQADYYGFELEADAKLGTALGFNWAFQGVADATRATIKGWPCASNPAAAIARRA